MGVRGLQTILENEKRIYPIDIKDEVNKWKRANPGQNPTIVIDFLCLANSYSGNYKDTICGGRHQSGLKSWRKLLEALKSTKCLLIFFSDLNIQEGKVDEWLGRRDREFVEYTKSYELIDSNVEVRKNRRALSSTFHGMAVIAREYGKFNESIRHECDLEMAKFAKNYNALAVITNDNDFLIFDGNWRMWSSQGIRVSNRNQLQANEYDRNAIAQIYSLKKYQLSLFATLLGNDFLNYMHLAKFHGKVSTEDRIKNVADYVREIGHANLTISQVAEKVFGKDNEDIEHLKRLIKESLDSYKVDFPPVQIDDPLEKKLLNTRMYRPYMENNWGIQGITMGFYDMRGPGAALPILLIDWIRRKKGILKRNTKDTFLVLAKKEINENFKAHTETVICPDFPLPSLDELYVETRNDSKIINEKWKLLAWIMSISNEVILLIKNLPKDILMISTILYVLVKNGLIGTEEADGILYTENMILTKSTWNTDFPTVLKSEYVRAAHIYNIAFGHVRQNFAIAGLLPHIQELLQFDGRYFQKLMEKTTAEREILFKSIGKYRIYANNS